MHISCHGIAQAHSGSSVNYLLFEDEHGNGQLVSEDSLRKLILRNLPNIGVVVVAACYSEFVGKIFQRIGARHVVCIDKSHQVMDQAILVFTRRFYSEVLANTPVCKAFVDAKNELLANTDIPDGQADIIKLLKEEDQELKQMNEANKVSNHVCYGLEICQGGEFVSSSEKHNVLKRSGQLTKLLFRETEMHAIITALRDPQKSEKLVCVTGPPMVGKSALLAHTCSHAKDRKWFLGGILHVKV